MSKQREGTVIASQVPVGDREMNTEILRARLNVLQEERAQKLAELNATIGKIEEMEGWLGWLDEKERAETRNDAQSPEQN